MTNYLKSVPMTSYIGEYIHQVIEHQPERIDWLCDQLRSQAKDNPPVMKNILGADAFDALMQLPEELIKY